MWTDPIKRKLDQNYLKFNEHYAKFSVVSVLSTSIPICIAPGTCWWLDSHLFFGIFQHFFFLIWYWFTCSFDVYWMVGCFVWAILFSLLSNSWHYPGVWELEVFKALWLLETDKHTAEELIQVKIVSESSPKSAQGRRGCVFLLKSQKLRWEGLVSHIFEKGGGGELTQRISGGRYVSPWAPP